MLTDTENAEQGAYSGSSRTRRRPKPSGKSAAKSLTNSRPDQEEDGGKAQEPKLSNLDFMLSILQSDLGEFRDFGGSVSFQEAPEFLIIRLADVHICQNHKMMHSGPTCPMC